MNGPHTIVKADLLDREITIAFAPSAESKKCKNLSMPLRRLGEYLERPETGDKDGRGFLMGRLKADGRRGIGEMHDTVLIGFDLDTGHDITDLKQRLRYQGIEAWFYATYSHLTTTSAVKGTAVAQWAKLPRGTAPSGEHAITFLRECKGYAPEILVGAIADRNDFDFTVWHNPQPRWRLVVPLSRAVALTELTSDPRELSERFKVFYRSVAKLLGVEHYDETCAEPSRLFYTHRRPEGATPVFERVAGQLLDPQSCLDEARNMPATRGKPQDIDISDVAVWFGKHGDGFRPADFLMTYGQDPRQVSPGKVEAVCPNQAMHSDGGNNRRTLVAMNRDASQNGAYVLDCNHATCKESLKLTGHVALVLQQHGLRVAALNEFAGVFHGPGPVGNSKTLIIQRASEIQPAPVQWLWPGRLAIGAMTLFAGDPGIGKSQIAASMAASITTGGWWPCGEGRAPKGSVVILSAEDDPKTVLIPRLIAAGADLDKVHIIPAVTVTEEDGRVKRRMVDLAEDIEALEEAIRTMRDVRLVDIDPVTAYLGKSAKARYSNTELRGVLDPLSEMAARMSVAVLAVSHFRKPGADSAGKAMHAVIDSIAYVAAARIVLGGIKDPDDEARVLMLHLKNNLAPPPAGLAARIKPRSIGKGIETTAVEWEPEHVTVKADDLMSRKGGDAPTQTSDVEDFLRAVLADGPVDVKTIEDDARSAGLLGDTQKIKDAKPFRSAKNKLGIVVKKIGVRDGWKWVLPSVVQSPAQIFH